LREWGYSSIYSFTSVLEGGGVSFTPGRFTPRESAPVRRIFEPKKEEVAGDWRKLHNEEGDKVKEEPR
jgi:hypothetical protein